MIILVLFGVQNSLGNSGNDVYQFFENLQWF